jgi:hypothetical protein
MRMNLGDPEAALPNLAAALADMLSPSFNAELRAATLDNATRPATAYGARWNQLDDSGKASRNMLHLLPKFPMLNFPNAAYYARIMPNYAQFHA